MGEKTSDCYIEVWRDADFCGEMIRIQGPAEYPNLRFSQGDWGDDIGSLRVGPNAFVLAYRDHDFKGGPVTFGPNDEIPDMRGLKFDDDVDSLKVIDSLKIFERLTYNAPPAPPAPADPKPKRNKPNRHKGRRR